MKVCPKTHLLSHPRLYQANNSLNHLTSHHVARTKNTSYAGSSAQRQKCEPPFGPVFLQAEHRMPALLTLPSSCSVKQSLYGYSWQGGIHLHFQQSWQSADLEVVWLTGPMTPAPLPWPKVLFLLPPDTLGVTGERMFIASTSVSSSW